MPTTTTQRVSLTPGLGAWTRTATLKQTDPGLGIIALRLSVNGTLVSDIQAESQELAPSVLQSADTGSVTLKSPAGSFADLSASFTTFTTIPLAPADGTADYAGPSGATLRGAVATGAASASYVAGGLATGAALPLVGTGTTTYGVTASARVSANGPGNLQAVFRSIVAATVTEEAQTMAPPPDTTTLGVISEQFGYDPGSLTFTPVGSTTAPQTRTIPAKTTGWSTTLNFAGFDPALGTLQGVSITVGTTLAGTVAVENLDPVAATATIRQASRVSVGNAAGTSLIATTASADTSASLAPFDGTIDDAGASGTTQTTAATNTTTSLITGTDAAAFIGTGTITIPVTDTGTDTLDLPGNAAIGTTLQSGATVTVSYVYTPGTPGSAALPPNPAVVAPGQTHTLTQADPNLTVDAGGTLIVPAGSFTSIFTVQPGGTAHVLTGAHVNARPLVGSNAASGAPAATLVVDAGASLASPAIGKGSVATVAGTTDYLDNSGVTTIAAGGVATNTRSTGGLHVLGTSSNAFITGGIETIEAGGVSIDDDIEMFSVTPFTPNPSSAAAIVGRGGSARGMGLFGGATLTVEPGGTATGTVLSGGTLIVRAGSVVSDLKVINQGNAVDFRDVPFTTNTTGGLGSDSVLNVATGGTAAAINLVPFVNGTSSPPPAAVRLSADAAGTGTLATFTNAGLATTEATTTTRAYTGPVDGIDNQYIAVSPATVAVSVSTDSWFLHGGGGDSALAAHGGRNVLDGGGRSSFLVGGTGQDSFFVTAAPGTTTWSTIANAHAGDDITLWGLQAGATPSWSDGQGAAGYTGLTLDAVDNTGTLSRATLAGYSSADLASGHVTLVSSAPGAATPYLYIALS